MVESANEVLQNHDIFKSAFQGFARLCRESIEEVLYHIIIYLLQKQLSNHLFTLNPPTRHPSARISSEAREWNAMNMKNVGDSYAGAPVITKFVSLSSRKKNLQMFWDMNLVYALLRQHFDSHYKNYIESNNQYSLQIPIF